MVATAVGEGVLESLAGLRPRAIVLVARRGAAVAAAGMVSAAAADDIDVPITQVTRTPEWVGPLDLVVVLGDDPGDPVVASSVAEALRRGASTVVAVPPEGPVGAAAGERATTVPPRVPVLASHRFAHHLAVSVAVLATTRPARAPRLVGSADVAAGIATVADLLDGEALRDAPGREAFRNPAKSIAAAMLGHDVVVAGDDAATAALARCAAADLLSTAGVAASGVELMDVLAAPVAEAAALSDPIFHDEQIDGPRAVTSRRVFVLATDADARVVGLRMAPLADGELVSAGVAELAPEVMPSGGPLVPGTGGDMTGPADFSGRPRDDGIDGIAEPPDAIAGGIFADAPPLVQFAVLAVRLQMAAAYVGLATAGRA